MTNLASNLVATATEHPDQDALRVNGQGVTYQQLLGMAAKVAGTLRENGFQPGDRSITFDGPPPISTADLQWVLHHAPAEGSIPVEIERKGERLNLSLTLHRASSAFTVSFSPPL